MTQKDTGSTKIENTGMNDAEGYGRMNMEISSKIQRPNRERMIEEFKELVAIDSESGNEREIVDVVKQKLIDMGAEVYEDDTQEITGSNAGNLFARFAATSGAIAGNSMGANAGNSMSSSAANNAGNSMSDSEGVKANGRTYAPLLFSAHLDTVKPGKGKKAVVDENGRITSEGETVLGADDLSGVVDILEGIRMVQEAGIEHGEIEALITVMEEAYAVGAKAFDCSRVKAKDCYVFDFSLPAGQAVVQAPTLISFTVTIHGKATHAADSPERGVHAIQIAAKAISRLKIGSVAEDTIFNIGTIEGGNGSNIVPDLCVMKGETRSYVHEKALAVIEEMKRIFEEEANAAGGRVEIDDQVRIRAYRTDPDSSVCRRFEEASRRAGIPEPEQRYHKVFGGSDNNQLMEKGLNGIVPGNGMEKCHTVDEYIDVEQFEAGARLVAELIALG